ncbi:MAG: zeta toxin family protein [Parachlamydiaceae bacterium]
MLKKQIFMIAGPNGAGKTTTAKFIMSQQKTIHEFINADEIARGLAPMHPESMALTASKLMIQRFKELLATNQSFAFETTAAGTNYIKHLQTAQSKGYEVHLFFLWLSSPELAIERVASRVAQGGHNIPEDTIRRRYILGMKNLYKHYLPLCNEATIMDNSLTELKKIIAEKSAMDVFSVNAPKIWQQIEGIAHA